MTDISDIIDQMEKEYPKWLVEGIAKSPEIKNMETALAKMAGITVAAKTAQKETAKVTKEVNQTFDTLIDTTKKLKKDFDDTGDSAKEASKHQRDLKNAHKKLHSSLLGAGKSLAQGKLSEASTGLTSGLMDAGKALSGWTGGLTLGIGLLADGLSRTVELIAKNNAAFTELSKYGYVFSNSLTGMSEAAINANMGLTDFTNLAKNNASVLAQWGDESATKLGDLSKSVRLGSNLMGRFGFNVGEINDYLTEYMSIQQRAGILNSKTGKDMDAGFKKFISDAADFSSVLGYSREQILKTVSDAAKSPDLDLYIQSLGKGGEKVMADFTTVSTQLASATGKYGPQVVDLLKDITTSGVAMNDQTRATQMRLASLDPELLKLIYSYGEQLHQGKNITQSNKEIFESSIKAVGAAKSETAMSLFRANLLGEDADGIADMIGHYKNLNEALMHNEKYHGDVNERMEQFIQDTEKDRDKHEESRQALANFNEMISTVSNILDTGLVVAINANKDSIESMAKYINAHAQPAISAMVDFMTKLMDDRTRGQIIDNIENGVIDIFSELMSAVLYKVTGGLLGHEHKAPVVAVSGVGIPTSPNGLAKSALAPTISGLGGMAAMGAAIKAGKAANTGTGGGSSLDSMIGNIIDKNEGGGKINSDTGGKTKWGISQKAYPGLDIGNLSKADAIEIYKRDYAGQINGFNSLSPQAQMMALDTAINQGPGFANKIVAQSNGDYTKMADLRKSKYESLASSNPQKYGKYLQGWENRVGKTSSMSADMVGSFQTAGYIAPTPSATPAAVIANNEAGVTATGAAAFTPAAASTSDVVDTLNIHLSNLAGIMQDQHDTSKKILAETKNNSSTI